MEAIPRPNVLLVDDKPANLVALEAVLEGDGFNLVIANSGREALALVEKEEFAAILLDIQMPGLDGYETARRIKKLPSGINVPIIFVTALYKEDEDIERGYEAGGIDYFAKPFNRNVIKTKVRIYADLYRKNRLLREQEKLLAEAQRRLEAERQLEGVLDTVAEGVIIADAGGKIIHANDEAQRIWGGAKFVHMESYELYTGWWQETGKRIASEDWAMARAIKNGEVSKNEVIRILAFDGKKRVILNSASPLRDENGKITGAVCVIRDITAKESDVERRNRRAHASHPRQ